MINLIVAGAGEQTYKNLWRATQSKNPDLGMQIAVVIDILEKEKLHPRMQEIIKAENIICLTPNDLETEFPIPENAAGIIMTPNDSHLWYAKYFISRGIPVYVEKPAVNSILALEEFLAIAKKYPGLVYASEYCTDSKAIGLLDAAGALDADDLRKTYLKTSSSTKELYRSMGKLRFAEGAMLEGEGTAGTADHRTWLLDGNQGGMIRDLAPHLIGPLYDLGFVDEDVTNFHVALGRYEPGQPLGTWRPLLNSAEGETYAMIEGKFPTSGRAASFRFEIGKYWAKNNRFLKLTFEKGTVTLNYEKPFEIIIETPSGRATSILEIEFYPTLVFLDFKKFLQNKTDGHIGRAAAIVKFNERARESGLREAGLC